MSYLNENGLSYYDSKIKQYVDNLISTHNVSSNSHQDIRELLDMALSNVRDWKDIQQLVRLGLAPMLFNIGDQFTCKRGNEELIWDIIGIDEDVPVTSTATISGTGITAVDVDYITFLGKTEEAGEFVFEYRQRHEHSLTYVWFNGNTEVNLADYGITITGTAAEGDKITVSIPHSITLNMHNVDSNSIIFSAPQAAFYIDGTAYPNGLAAGTYNFGWVYASGSITAGTYQFTITEPIPVGGQIAIGTNGTSTALTACTISTYGTAGSTIAIESDVTIIAGDEGISLGTVGTTTITSSRTIAQRIVAGSNNYITSAARQYLNSNQAANLWWEAQSNFDRPANADKNGFLYGMDEDFVSVMGDVLKITTTNALDGANTQISSERVFLLSRTEVYGGAQNNITDGIPYGYYRDNSDLHEAGTGADANRIKVYVSSGLKYWLRTANAANGSGTGVAYVLSNGSINNVNANSLCYVAPACVIY